MKKLFQAIRKGDLDEVRRLLEQKPSLVNCTAKQPPKKDDGQSPLQVAVKTHQFAIANELLNRGADVNFMEDSTTCCDDWCMPVLHIAAMAAVNCCRHNSQFDTGEVVFFIQEPAHPCFGWAGFFVFPGHAPRQGADLEMRAR